MKARPAEASPRLEARLAGVFWLMTILAGALALFTRGRHQPPSDGYGSTVATERSARSAPLMERAFPVMVSLALDRISLEPLPALTSHRTGLEDERSGGPGVDLSPLTRPRCRAA